MMMCYQCRQKKMMISESREERDTGNHESISTRFIALICPEMKLTFQAGWNKWCWKPHVLIFRSCISLVQSQQQQQSTNLLCVSVLKELEMISLPFVYLWALSVKMVGGVGVSMLRKKRRPLVHPYSDTLTDQGKGSESTHKDLLA